MCLCIKTLGPLIHNNQVLKQFEEKGVHTINNPENIKGTVVIRAHGIAPALRKELLEKGARLIDATCPRVLRSQKVVKKHSKSGGFVVLVGDKDHGEVTAIAGCAESCVVIQTVEQAENIDIPDNTLVISQTTVKKDEYESICSILITKNPLIKIVGSICPATQARQDSLKTLAAKADAFIIIGGKTSANSKRLYLTAKASGKPSWFIEDENDLPEEIYQYEIIGISAGASTPDWIIDAVEKKLIHK